VALPAQLLLRYSFCKQAFSSSIDGGAWLVAVGFEIAEVQV
jgi:hypothetical protein